MGKRKPHGATFVEAEDGRGAYLIVSDFKGDTFLIDPEDRQLVEAYRWNVCKFNRTRNRQLFYVTGYVEGKNKAIHRIIMGDPPGMQVDHRDANGLNCRRYNLRVCTLQQNRMNDQNRRLSPTGKRGVYETCLGKFAVQITLSGKSRYFGIWPDLETASRVRDEIVLKHRGEFAVLNDPL